MRTCNELTDVQNGQSSSLFLTPNLSIKATKVRRSEGLSFSSALGRQGGAIWTDPDPARTVNAYEAGGTKQIIFRE